MSCAMLGPSLPVPGQVFSGFSRSKFYSNLIVVPALVRDRSGELVFGMHEKDFSLTDDGILQALQDTGSEPIALVVVIEANAPIARPAGILAR